MQAACTLYMFVPASRMSTGRGILCWCNCILIRFLVPDVEFKLPLHHVIVTVVLIHKRCLLLAEPRMLVAYRPLVPNKFRKLRCVLTC